jgi:hypothetical protein
MEEHDVDDACRFDLSRAPDHFAQMQVAHGAAYKAAKLKVYELGCVRHGELLAAGGAQRARSDAGAGL